MHIAKFNKYLKADFIFELYQYKKALQAGEDKQTHKHL